MEVRVIDIDKCAYLHSVREIDEWLARKSRDCAVYYIGNLAYACESSQVDERERAFAQEARKRMMKAFERGDVELVQKRISFGEYAYVAIKRMSRR